MIFRSNAAPRNRRATNTKRKRSKSFLEVNIRSDAAARQRNSKIMKWLCILILLGTVSAGIYWGVREGLRRFVTENPDYRLTSLEIITDGALTREQIIANSGIHEGTNIFSINLSRSQQDLMKMPRVELAEITRTLPNRIAINITERKPVAWIAAKNTEDPSSDQSSFLVDRRGTLISGRNYLPEYLHLPIIYGIPTDNLEAGETVDTYELRSALDLVRITSESAKIQVRSIDLSKRYCMIITDQSRARITFGLEKLDEQLDRLAAVMEHVETTKQEIQTVNLMVQRNIPVTFASPSSDAPAAAPKTDAAAPPQKSPKIEKLQPEERKARSDSSQPKSSHRDSPSKLLDAKTRGHLSPRESHPVATEKSSKKASHSDPPRPAGTPEKERFMDNLPVRKAIPVTSAPGPIRHNG